MDDVNVEYLKMNIRMKYTNIHLTTDREDIQLLLCRKGFAWGIKLVFQVWMQMRMETLKSNNES